MRAKTMNLPKRTPHLLFFCCSAMLAMPGLARAQLDDPGLEQAPPAPVAPKPVPAARPAVAAPPRDVATQARPAPILPPPVNPAREPAIREEVKEEVSTAPLDAKGDDEWEARLAAPSLIGSIGLLRMHTTDIGKPLNFRVGLHLQGFTQSSFLVAGGNGLAGDDNARFLGDLTIGLTGPDFLVLRNLELYLGIFNSSNQNKRVDQGRTDPTVILALGDVGVGLRGAGEVAKGFSIGANLNVRFLNSISAVLANFDATNVAVDLLLGYDVRRVAPKVPLRFHLNFGYQNDPSLNILPKGQCANSQGNDPCIRSRVVETFAYGLGVPRLRLAFGLELPFRPHVPWGIFGVSLFGEYHYDRAVGDGDTTVAGALTKAGINADRIGNANIQSLTFGLRLRPFARLIVDLGVDVGLQSPGFRYGPPLPPWNVIFGLGYAYDTAGASTKTIKRTVTRTIEVERAAYTGRLRGVIRDAKTKKPLSGAVISYQGKQLSSQAADANGTFVSYDLPAGDITLEVSRGDDYNPGSSTATVNVGGESPVEILLQPRPPKESKVRLKVYDERGGSVVGGQAVFNGAVTREGVADGDGFVTTLPPGEYIATIDAPGFLAKEKLFSVMPGRDSLVEMKVQKRPKASRVQVTRDQILIKGVIHFGTNNATILPDGQQLLDEVVDALAKNRNIRKVSIEGHTDNRGNADKNVKLSKDRAKAVFDYLLKQGIGADRLSHDGFGATKPLVPNTNAANRTKNRRVEFRIVDQAQAL